MKSCDITLNPSETTGTIKNILGMCNSPRINYAPHIEKEKKLFRELDLAMVRYHDTETENPGYALIDVSRIFPLFHADADDPRNYIFGPTDLYLQTASDCGVEIEFRLGESIEHAPRKFRVLPPADPEKWADICIHIIRHYNEGWANGMHLGIRNWSIWEEPDNNPLLFAGKFETFLNFFGIAFHRIKAACPDILLGGVSASMPYCFKDGNADRFFQFCIEQDIRPDFLCWTGYGRTPERYIYYARLMKEYAEKYGFGDVPRRIAECHLGPQDWYYKGEAKGEVDPEMNNEVSAAFATATLTALLDCGIDIATHYMWCYPGWGAIAADATPYKIYYGLKYFTEMTHCTARLAIQTNHVPEETRLLAGITSEGSVKLLISCYKVPAAEYTIHLDSFSGCRWKRITQQHANPELWEPLPMTDGSVSVPFEDGGCACFMLEFTKEH